MTRTADIAGNSSGNSDVVYYEGGKCTLHFIMGQKIRISVHLIQQYEQRQKTSIWLLFRKSAIWSQF